MKKEDFKVGQTVYIESSKYSRNQTLEEFEVIIVGRKYITVKSGWRELKFDIKTGIEKCEYGAAATMYLNKQQVLDKQQQQDLFKVISSHFSYGSSNIPLDKLIKIKEIIDNE